MTGVVITFVTDATIKIANDSGVSITFAIAKLLPAGTFDTAEEITVADGEFEEYLFITDGFYRVQNKATSNGVSIIISNIILTALENDVKEILLLNKLGTNLALGYDFMVLALLSILFIGNTEYQNVAYDVANLTEYTTIATVADRCTKYMDISKNTPQSNNKLWL